MLDISKYYHPCMLNTNNENTVLIDRALYIANRKLYALENSILSEIRSITKSLYREA